MITLVSGTVTDDKLSFLIFIIFILNWISTHQIHFQLIAASHVHMHQILSCDICNMQLLLIIIIHWLNRLTDRLSCILFWKNMKKHKEFVSIHKASCHSSPGDLLSLKDDRTPLWRLRKFSRFIIDHPVTCWILSFTPHRWSVAGNPYETDPAYVLSSFKWCTLWPFSGSHTPPNHRLLTYI